jgi:hypothetical protein
MLQPLRRLSADLQLRNIRRRVRRRKFDGYS